MINIIDEKDLAWLGFLLCFSFALFGIFKASKVAPGKEKLLAYVLTSLINHICFTTYGMSALFNGTMSELSTDSTSRTAHANLDDFVNLAHYTYAYEIFNTMAAIVIPEYRTGEFLGHHILTSIISKFSQTEGPDFYGFFFFGIASASTMTLVIVDIFRHGPPYLRETFPAVNTISQVLFAFLFLLIRATIWPLVSLVFWYDTVHIIRYPPEISPYRPYLFILLMSNTFLSCLQLMWAKRIIQRLKMILFKSPPDSSKVEDRSESKEE